MCNIANIDRGSKGIGETRQCWHHTDDESNPGPPIDTTCVAVDTMRLVQCYCIVFTAMDKLRHQQHIIHEMRKLTQKSNTMIDAIGPKKTAYALMKFKNDPADARIF